MARELKPFTAAELADRLGVCVDTFYRKYDGYVHDDGMPAALSKRGRYKFDRNSMEAWLGRHHPLAPRQAPANDSAPPRVETIEEQQRELARAYGGGRR